VLHSEPDPAVLVEDVRATRAEGPDDGGLVVVEGVWSAASGAPPPVLLVDDGARRHTLAALPSPPPDDPTGFRATFAVPRELMDRLGENLALGIGRVELPLKLSPPGAGGASWLEGAAMIAGSLADESRRQPDDDGDVPVPPGRRFQRGGSSEPAEAAHEGIAAAILRVTSPPPPESATVVERSVIAERRARRSEQLAAVMERRARGAEDTARELSASVGALEERLAAVTAERDRLAAELQVQRAAVAQAQRAREAVEARLVDLLSERGAEVAAAVAAPGSVRALPGLEEAARALREQEPPRPAAPAEGPDPFADALAKLRARSDLAAVAAPRVVAERAAPEAAVEPEAPPSAPPMREQVIPYVIAAEHPRTAWLARAIAALDERDRAAAAQLAMALLPDQARTVRRPLVYDLDLDGLGALRVELEARGAGRVTPREGRSFDASFSLEATPAELAPLAAGGAPLFPRGLRVGGARRFFLPVTRLSRSRRRPLSLADVSDAGLALDVGLVVRALACAVPPEWTAGQAFAVTLSVPGSETCRVHVADGAPLHVVRVDEAGKRTVVATTAGARSYREGAVAGADAVLRAPKRGALPLLGQAEPPDAVAPATVLGDLAAATTLLSWFDRVQGLKARA
jgi:hypothetical protein